MKPHHSPRALAWKCLCRWESGGAFAESLIQRAGQSLPAPDRALLQAIVLGTLRHLRWLEHILYTLRGNRPLQSDARWLLVSGLCQLFVLDMPDYAVVNEQVALAPRHLRPLVNGILRQALRRAADWQAELPTLPLGVRFSMPDWIVERWLARWGEDECQALLQAANEPAPVCVRLNSLRPMPEVPEDWVPVPDAPGWYTLCSPGLPLEQLQAGHIYVADPSTRFCIDLLAPRPGERILDTCAAPGGKSAAILSATHGECFLLATDAEDHRLPQLKENLARTGARHIDIARHDWTLPCPEEWRAAFDAILVDAPCSNSGVFRRRVDARWRLTPTELAALADTQLNILQNALAALRPGGRLVYSTCSIDADENDAVIRRLLSLHPALHFERDFLALPHRLRADGAYAALCSLSAANPG